MASRFAIATALVVYLILKERAPLDILLVDPPYITLKGTTGDRAYNMGLTSLAAYLRREGLETAVLTGDLLVNVRPGLGGSILPGVNQNIRRYAAGQREYARIVCDDAHPIWKKLEERIRRVSPAMVGIAYITPLKHVVIRVARVVKGIDRDIKVIVGSFHPTFCPEEVMGHMEIDFVVRGEGEMPLSCLVKELKKTSPQLESVPGIHYREKGGQVHGNPPAPLIDNLDGLPFPARDLVLDCDYREHRLHFISSARGCPYTCSFCADRRLWNGRVRRRSVASVIEELKFLKEKYSPSTIDFSDGTFTFDRKYLRDFCKSLLEEKLDIKWRCTARFDNLDEEILDLMKRSGCSGLYFGLESGSDRLLHTMDKKMTVESMSRVCRMVRRIGIPSATSVLLGLPDETPQDIEATLRVMKSIKTDMLDINSYIPIPGTPLYDAMSQPERESVDWLTTGYKSLDNYFSRNISRQDFDRYQRKAYSIAARTLTRSILRMGTARLFRGVAGVFSRPKGG